MVFVIDATVDETDAMRVVDAILDHSEGKDDIEALTDAQLTEAVKLGLLPDADRGALWGRVQAIRESAEHDQINVYTDGYVDVLCGDKAEADWEGEQDKAESELSDGMLSDPILTCDVTMGLLIAAHYFELDPYHFPAMDDVTLEFKAVV